MGLVDFYAGLFFFLPPVTAWSPPSYARRANKILVQTAVSCAFFFSSPATLRDTLDELSIPPPGYNHSPAAVPWAPSRSFLPFPDLPEFGAQVFFIFFGWASSLPQNLSAWPGVVDEFLSVFFSPGFHGTAIFFRHRGDLRFVVPWVSSTRVRRPRWKHVNPLSGPKARNSCPFASFTAGQRNPIHLRSRFPHQARQFWFPAFTSSSSELVSRSILRLAPNFRVAFRRW